MNAPHSDDPDNQSNFGGNDDSTKANPLPSTVSGDRGTGSHEGSIAYSPGFLLDPPSKPESIGRIQEYDVQSMEGRGAMGSVFRAFDSTLNRTVAIKLMVAELSATPGARERFVREAQSAASINHANVVTVHAVGDHHGLPFLVMEFIHGETLQDLIRKRGMLSVEDTLRIAHQIASGLLAAHQKGIVHRDVKPSNILIENGVQRVKIADFGLARVALEASGLTSHGQTVGTPGYMSPEQVEGHPVDCRADLFSLGCVIYAMLTGHTPFRAGNTLAVLQAVAKQPHAPLSQVAPSTPPALADFVEKLLKKDPAARLGSAAQALAELETLTRTVGTPSRIAATAQKAEAEAVLSHERRERWRKVRSPVAGLAGVMLLGAILMLRGTSLLPVGPTTTPISGRTMIPTEDAPPILPLTMSSHVIVGDQPGADFPTVREALARDPAPQQIRVVTTADHEEAISISGERHAGLEVVWEGPGALRAPSGRGVFRVANVPALHLHGARIIAQASQHGVIIEGNCPGLTISDCDISQPDGTQSAAVYFSKATGASAEAPMTLRRTRITGSDLAIALIGSEKTPVQHWRAEDCLFLGVRDDSGAVVVIEGPCSHLSFIRNRLVLYGVGLSIGAVEDSFDVVGNTLSDVRHFFSTRESISVGTPFNVADNLLIRVGVGQIDPHLKVIRADAFHDNLRVGLGSLDWPGIRDIPAVNFVSLQTTSPDFLRPSDASAVRLTPMSENPARYAGALLPLGVLDKPEP
jgi:hypothetical protein